MNPVVELNSIGIDVSMVAMYFIDEKNPAEDGRWNIRFYFQNGKNVGCYMNKEDVEKFKKVFLTYKEVSLNLNEKD